MYDQDPTRPMLLRAYGIINENINAQTAPELTTTYSWEIEWNEKKLLKVCFLFSFGNHMRVAVRIIHTHLKAYSRSSFHVSGMFMPNVAATKE